MKICLLCGGPAHTSAGCPKVYPANDYLVLQDLYIRQSATVKKLENERDALRAELSGKTGELDALKVQVAVLTEALERIRAKLSATEVPRDQWVRDLHGELFSIAHYTLAKVKEKP